LLFIYAFICIPNTGRHIRIIVNNRQFTHIFLFIGNNKQFSQVFQTSGGSLPATVSMFRIMINSPD
jgi:hypothetical protein